MTAKETIAALEERLARLERIVNATPACQAARYDLDRADAAAKQAARVKEFWAASPEERNAMLDAEKNDYFCAAVMARVNNWQVARDLFAGLSAKNVARCRRFLADHIRFDEHMRVESEAAPTYHRVVNVSDSKRFTGPLDVAPGETRIYSDKEWRQLSAKCSLSDHFELKVRRPDGALVQAPAVLTHEVLSDDEARALRHEQIRSGVVDAPTTPNVSQPQRSGSFAEALGDGLEATL